MIDYVSMLNKPNQAEGDYKGEDGLLYCGKCHEPKQARIEGLSRIVSVPCTCIKRKDEEAELRRREKQIEDLRSYCLPFRAMRGATFATADSAEHIKIAQRYVEKWDRVKAKNIGLIFYGNTGTGKTFTALCIANALIDREISVLYVRAVDLVTGVTDNRGDFMRRVETAPLMVIDDLGAEHDARFTQSQICSVIDARVETGRPMIVTTNYTLAELQNSRKNARTFDRIMSVCVPVLVSGESKRKDQGSDKLRIAKELLLSDG